MGKWYPLDNAAQIFPALIKKHDTNSFRLSALLYETVNPEILKQKNLYILITTWTLLLFMVRFIVDNI